VIVRFWPLGEMLDVCERRGGETCGTGGLGWNVRYSSWRMWFSGFWQY